MKRVRRSLAFILAFMLLVTGIPGAGITVNAENEGKETEITSYVAQDVDEESEEEEQEADESKTEKSEAEESSSVEESEESTSTETTSEEKTTVEETTEEVSMETEPITSVKYEVTVENSDSTASFEWKAQAASWQEKATTVKLDGDGDYSFELAFDYEEGLKNLGYIMPISDSEMTVTVNKIIVNGYELTYKIAPVLQPGVNNANGLANIWNIDPEVTICGGDNAYLALDKKDGAIQLYAEQEEESEEESTEQVEAQLLTSLTYHMTVADSEDTESFIWNVQAASWNAMNQTVTLAGDGEYEVSFQLDYEEGMKNLGYIEPMDGSSMTATITKIVVNDTYELEYETAPVLKAGENGANGLANIWNVEPEVRICGNDDAYFALDKKDGAITFYTKSEEEDTSKKEGTSLDYVKAMGSGWNLGNSFDGVNEDLEVEDTGELAWGNPTVTRELLAAVKEKGYDSIRIPFTIYRRYSVNENAGENEYKYIINEDWLARYKEVVNWAVDEGFYVMINIHHDSWIWLKYWDGDKASEEYRMYTDFWKQLAEYMADLPEQVCFETINEPDFEENAQQKLDAINQAAYDIIRGTKGNEERMIVIPSVYTNYEKCVPLYNFIKQLDDENVIATVHYYSEWVYSANLGKTSFDEELWQNNGESYTPRDAADNLMNTLQKQFISNGIGVIIGEYGLLGYDASEGCLQTGEELKYYEYMNELARQNNVCLVFWDNGSGINRTNGSYTWKKPTVGEMLENSMTGRSSYATGLDTLYFKEEIQEDVEVALTLNGNTFRGIQIPVDFNGSVVRRVTAYQASGKVGPNSDWWNYLQYDGSFGVDYEKETINLLSAFFADASVKDGLMKLKVEFYDGQIAYIWLNVDGNKVTSNPDLEVKADAIDASTTICLYAGETSIPSQYLDMPEGGSAYGTWVDETANNGMVTLEGWPCKMIFDTKAHDDFVSGGIVLYYMDVEKYVDVTFGIKDAPTVEDVEVKASASKKITVNNLAEDAEVSYKSSSTSIATVSADGTVTGKKAGNAVITVTVEQYNRSDDFEVAVKVTGSSSTSQGQTSSSGGQSSDSQSQSSSSSTTVATTQETVKQETTAQEITEQQVPLAEQPVIEEQAVAQQPAVTEKSQTTRKAEIKKVETVEDETTVESEIETIAEDASGFVISEKEVQETVISTENVEEKVATLEDEATPLATEQLQEKSSPLPFIIAGIVVVIFVAGVAVIYFKKKENIVK